MTSTIDGTASTRVELRDQAYIDGEWRDGRGGSFEVRSPHTGELFNTMTRCDVTDVEAAVAAARAAQPGWAATSLAERVELMRKVSQLFVENGAEIARTVSAEIGKTITETNEEIFEYAAPSYARLAEEMIRFHGLVMPSTQEHTTNKRIVLTHRPQGVVAVISPYNFPTDISSVGLAAAMVSGNTVVWKPSEYAPTCCAMVAQLIEAAGVPPGVFNFVPGMGDIGMALVEHDSVDAIFFTGSTTTGELIRSRAGLKRVLLELGGDGPQIVLPDADLDAAAAAAVVGVFYLAGQCCTSSERLIVHEAVYDEFMAKFKALTAELVIGDPLDPGTDMGPLCNAGTLERVKQHVADAVAKGATCTQHGPEQGLYYPATILENVTDEMAVATQETFGPVGAVFKVSSTDEAIELSWRTGYGLIASLWTRDLATAWRVSEALPHGAVNVNETSNYWDQNAPFGGANRSGVGREMSKWFFETFTEPKLIVFDLGDAQRRGRRVLGGW